MKEFRHNDKTWVVRVDDKRASALSGWAKDPNMGYSWYPTPSNIIQRIICYLLGLSKPTIFIGSGIHQDAILGHELGHVACGHMDNMNLVKEIGLERAACGMVGAVSSRALQWECEADAYAVGVVGREAVLSLLEYYRDLIMWHGGTTIEIDSRIAAL